MEARGARIWIFVGFVLGFAAIIAAVWVMIASFSDESEYHVLLQFPILMHRLIIRTCLDLFFQPITIQRIQRAVGPLWAFYCKMFSFSSHRLCTSSAAQKNHGTCKFFDGPTFDCAPSTYRPKIAKGLTIKYPFLPHYSHINMNRNGR